MHYIPYESVVAPSAPATCPRHAGASPSWVRRFALSQVVGGGNPLPVWPVCALRVAPGQPAASSTLAHSIARYAARHTATSSPDRDHDASRPQRWPHRRRERRARPGGPRPTRTGAASAGVLAPHNPIQPACPETQKLLLPVALAQQISATNWIVSHFSLSRPETCETTAQKRQQARTTGVRTEKKSNHAHLIPRIDIGEGWVVGG